MRSFNALTCMEILESHGIPTEQAKAQVEVLLMALDDQFESLASKNDVQLLQKDMQHLEQRVEQVDQGLQQLTKKVDALVDTVHAMAREVSHLSTQMGTLRWLFGGVFFGLFVGVCMLALQFFMHIH